MLSALLDGIRGEVIFADGDDARDDRDDLRDVLAKGSWRGRTPDSIDNVLDGPYDGVGLGFEVRLEGKKSQRPAESPTTPMNLTFNSFHASSGAS